MYSYSDNFDKDDDKPDMTDDNRTALTSDSGNIPTNYQWKETIDVSSQFETDEGWDDDN